MAIVKEKTITSPPTMADTPIPHTSMITGHCLAPTIHVINAPTKYGININDITKNTIYLTSFIATLGILQLKYQ